MDLNFKSVRLDSVTMLYTDFCIIKLLLIINKILLSYFLGGIRVLIFLFINSVRGILSLYLGDENRFLPLKFKLVQPVKRTVILS